jgi:hypothetical protein
MTAMPEFLRALEDERTVGQQFLRALDVQRVTRESPAVETQGGELYGLFAGHGRALNPVGGNVSCLEGARHHRLPQRLRALQVRVDLGLDLADDGEAAVDFGDDAGLRGSRRENDRR